MGWDISKQIGKRIPIIEKSVVSYVDMEKITHITCDGYVSIIHLINGLKYPVARLLKHFEEELAEYGFLRVNRHTLVNIRYVDDTKISERILRIGETIITVSKRKLHLCKKKIK